MPEGWSGDWSEWAASKVKGSTEKQPNDGAANSSAGVEIGMPPGVGGPPGGGGPPGVGGPPRVEGPPEIEMCGVPGRVASSPPAQACWSYLQRLSTGRRHVCDLLDCRNHTEAYCGTLPPYVRGGRSGSRREALASYSWSGLSLPVPVPVPVCLSGQRVAVWLTLC